MIVSHNDPEFTVAQVVEHTSNQKAYFRIRDHAKFPSLGNTDLLMRDGAYTGVKAASPTPELTFVPPSLIGPPELVHVDMKDTDEPGLIIVSKGKGTVAWIPWDLAALYYNQSLPAHKGLFRDTFDRLVSERQIRTDAHPLVEITWMQQNDRQLIHLVNLSGHSETAYFSPVPFTNIHIKLAGNYTAARAIRSRSTLSVKPAGRYSEITVPALNDYELLIVQ